MRHFYYCSVKNNALFPSTSLHIVCRFQTVENVICVLRNMSYQLESEVDLQDGAEDVLDRDWEAEQRRELEEVSSRSGRVQWNVVNSNPEGTPASNRGLLLSNVQYKEGVPVNRDSLLTELPFRVPMYMYIVIHGV